jgi:hypothetical protein
MGDRNGNKDHKKETKSKRENLRGITLLPTAYKLFANLNENKHLDDEMVKQ